MRLCLRTDDVSSLARISTYAVSQIKGMWHVIKIERLIFLSSRVFDIDVRHDGIISIAHYCKHDVMWRGEREGDDEKDFYY